MPTLSIDAMRSYLSKSIASLNHNKVRGLLAEVAFRDKIRQFGFASRVSAGGWIARSDQGGSSGIFGSTTVVFFPHILNPTTDYDAQADPPPPSRGLHTICATFRQLGIRSYYCAPHVLRFDEPESVQWSALELGIPADDEHFRPFPQMIEGFRGRTRKCNFLTNHADTSIIPQIAVSEEFSKEHLRVTFCRHLMSEIADLDCLFWGNQHTYPVEVKEKTVAGVRRKEQVINGVKLKPRHADTKLGPWFGLDIGPFTKLAFFAAKRGNLHALFVVREIDNEVERNEVGWWFITFEQLAQFAGWNYSGGGEPMTGGRSATVKIPKVAFTQLTADAIAAL